MTIRTATCCCGKLKVTCEGDPVRASMCHCLACQQRTGSVFGVQARFPADKVKFEGATTTYVRTGDSGGKASFRFCPTCGSTVFWEIDKLPGFIAVAVGAFADPTFLAPKVSIYEARRHKWTRMPDLDIEIVD
jgi:hypothetical protein